MGKTIINALPVGTTLQKGKYTIREVLGQGTFGITYLAKTKLAVQGSLGVVEVEASVAVKEFFMSGCNGRSGMSVTYSGSDGLHDEYMRKFRHEAEHLSHFQHDNIVRVLEMFEENGTWYYAMEYIDGGSLNDYILRHGRLPADEALSLARQVAGALAYLHGQKALHLDLKPSNIMLRDNGQPVLIDFGLTKQYASDGRAETSTSIGLGTQGYAPMEQNNYHKGKKFAPTIDIYALGATLYKMLTGSTPPAATDIFNEGFPESDLKAAGADDKTIALVRKAMEPRSNDRYRTADEMAAAIARLNPAGLTASNNRYVQTEDEKTILDTGAAVNRNNEKKIEPQKPKEDVINHDSEQNIESQRPKKDIINPVPSKEEREGRRTLRIWCAFAALFVGLVIVYDLAMGSGSRAVEEAEVVWWVDTSVVDTSVVDTTVVDDYSSSSTTLRATGTIAGHEYVDLGLSVMWATCNVGAGSPEDYGEYYAWGETKTKSSYDEGNCATYGKSIGDIGGTSRDVARVKWGSPWRMPTKAEFDELLNTANCTWEWTTLNGKKGYKVTSRKDDNSIFLPAAGWRYGTSLDRTDSWGDYWISTPYESYTQSAYYLHFNGSLRDTDWLGRYFGYSVRPVAEF